MVSTPLAKVFTTTVAAGLAMTLMAAPSAAQQAIMLEAGEPYVHPHSGITVPAALGGIAPRRAMAFAPDALDVALSYDTPGTGESLSVYVFRKTNGAVPIWFAQAQSALEMRDQFAEAELAFMPAAFMPPGQAQASGLRATYGLKSGEYRSTGLALFEVNGWYVKLRASSRTRSSEQLHGWMDEVLASLVLPQGNAPAVVPIADCAEPLRFRGRARDVKSDDAASVLGGLLGSLLASAQSEQEDEPDAAEATPEPVVWCRDEQLGAARATYRANASSDSYLLGFGDSGVGISVAPDTLSALFSTGGNNEADKESLPYAITLMMTQRNISFVAQDRLPSPKRVLELIENNRAIGSTTTWGDDKSIQVNSGAL